MLKKNQNSVQNHRQNREVSEEYCRVKVYIYTSTFTCTSTSSVCETSPLFRAIHVHVMSPSSKKCNCLTAQWTVRDTGRPHPLRNTGKCRRVCTTRETFASSPNSQSYGSYAGADQGGAHARPHAPPPPPPRTKLCTTWQTQKCPFREEKFSKIETQSLTLPQNVILDPYLSVTLCHKYEARSSRPRIKRRTSLPHGLTVALPNMGCLTLQALISPTNALI